MSTILFLQARGIRARKNKKVAKPHLSHLRSPWYIPCISDDWRHNWRLPNSVASKKI